MLYDHPIQITIFLSCFLVSTSLLNNTTRVFQNEFCYCRDAVIYDSSQSDDKDVNRKRRNRRDQGKENFTERDNILIIVTY